MSPVEPSAISRQPSAISVQCTNPAQEGNRFTHQQDPSLTAQDEWRFEGRLLPPYHSFFLNVVKDLPERSGGVLLTADG
jgi:hypothetical protein